VCYLCYVHLFAGAAAGEHQGPGPRVSLSFYAWAFSLCVGVRMQDTRSDTSLICFPQTKNVHGKVFGGASSVAVRVCAVCFIAFLFGSQVWGFHNAFCRLLDAQGL
jgi:hypothetical protein